MAPDTSRGESLGQPAASSVAAQWLARALNPARTGLEALGRFILLTVDTLRWLVRPPFRVGQLMNAMEFIGVQSLFIIMLTGTFSGMVFARFVSGSTGTMVIYAGFAIVIVALIWLYVSWLILLLGTQLAFYVQNPQYLRPGRGLINLNASMRERVALSIRSAVMRTTSLTACEATRVSWSIALNSTRS